MPMSDEELRAKDEGATPPHQATSSPNATLRNEDHDQLTPWPFGLDGALRLIAATGNPNERREDRDGWAVTMRDRPDVLAIEVDRARTRLEQAIRAALSTHTDPEEGE